MRRITHAGLTAILVMSALAAVVASSSAVASAQVADDVGPYYVTFVARECDEYTDIFANRARNNLQESLQNLGPDTPYERPEWSPFQQVLPAVEALPPQDSCRPITNFTFSLGDGIADAKVQNLSVVSNPDTPTITTEASAPELDSKGQRTGRDLEGAVVYRLTRAQIDRAFNGQSLWAQQGTTTDPLNTAAFGDTYSFGALRCAVDNLNGDNVEYIAYPTGVRNVFCYAFDVAAPPEPATIISRVAFTPGAPAATQTFQFGGNVSYEPGGLFDLTVTGGAPGEESFTRDATTPDMEPWRLVQQKAAGYIIDSVDCVSATTGSTIFEGTGGPGVTAIDATIELAAGDTVTCTFYNAPEAPPPGTVRIRKTTLGAAGGPFDITLGESRLSATTVAPGQTVIAGDVQVAAGATYPLSETLPDDGYVWEATSAACDGEPLTATGPTSWTLTVPADGDADCVIINTGTPQGSITIEKETSGGLGTFGFTIAPVSGELLRQTPFVQTVTTSSEGVLTTATGDALTNLPYGRYLITEIGPPETDVGRWSLDSAACGLLQTRNRPSIGIEVTITPERAAATCRFGNSFVPLPPPARPAARFVALTPARILDTRTQNGQVGYEGPKPGPDESFELQVAGRGGVPAENVTAVVMTVTATESLAEGYITVWPTGEVQPHISNLNARPEPLAPLEEQAVPNLVTVPLGVDGKVSIYTQAETDILGDVAGFYQEVSVSAEGRFQSLGDPVRVLDTRPESGPLGYTGDKPAEGQTVTFQVAGRAGVPAAGAASVVLNVTATQATARGFVTAFPAGQVLPWASNLNLEYVDQTVSDQVVVPLGADGAVSLYTQSGTHLVADIAGWFTDASAPVDDTGLFRAVTPNRRLDTRNSSGLVPPDGTVTVNASFAGLIPDSGVSAVIANVTATETLAAGFITAFPTGSSLPWASNLNLDRADQTLPNLVTVGVGAGTTFDLYTQSGSQLVADLFGWYVA